jgi:hypothetical protein
LQFGLRPGSDYWVRIEKNQIDGAIIHGVISNKNSTIGPVLQVTLAISKPKDQLGQSLLELLRRSAAGGGDPVGI